MTMSATARPTLAVEGLKTEFTTRGGVARAVDDVSFAVGRGEIMGLVGELWMFMRERKKFWLLPVLAVVLVVGTMLVFAQGSALTPFIYTIF